MMIGLVSMIGNFISMVAGRVVSSHIVKKTLPEPIRHAPISDNEKKLMQLHRELSNRKQDVELKRQELVLQAKISKANLDLMQKHHVENVELKLKEIQADYDKYNWQGILSRNETVEILTQGKQENRFLILLSPPDVSPNCPLTFQHDLGKTLRGKVKEFVETYYPPQSDFPVQFFGKFFKSSIFDTEAVQLENLLSVVPTAVIFSDLTNKELLLHIHVWGVMGGKMSLSSSFEWKAEFKKLLAAGKDEEDALDEIETAIVQTHKLLSGFLTDVYFLQVNPLHEPQLFLIDRAVYPAELTGQLLGQLRQLQQEKRAEYEKLLLEKNSAANLKYERIDSSYKTSTKKYSQPIEVSENLWYGKPEGLALLRSIDTDLKYKFQNYQMSRDVGTEKISFSFIRNGDNWQIELPHNFPNSLPRFKVNSRGFYNVIWRPDSKLIDVIQNCFDLYEKNGLD
jgi:hypothetical protein